MHRCRFNALETTVQVKRKKINLCVFRRLATAEGYSVLYAIEKFTFHFNLLKRSPSLLNWLFRSFFVQHGKFMCTKFDFKWIVIDRGARCELFVWHTETDHYSIISISVFGEDWLNFMGMSNILTVDRGKRKKNSNEKRTDTETHSLFRKQLKYSLENWWSVPILTQYVHGIRICMSPCGYLRNWVFSSVFLFSLHF